MAGEAGSGGGAPPGGSPTPPSKALEQTHGLRDYYRVLAANRQFRFLWCAEMIDNIGSWLVRGLDERPDRGLATDGLILCITAPFGCRLAALVLRLLNLLHAPPRKPLPHSRTWPPWSWWSSLAAAVGWPSLVWSSSASCPPSSSHPSAAWWPTGARACPHRLLCGSVTGLGTRIPEAAKQILPACCPQATHACQPALCLPLNRFPDPWHCRVNRVGVLVVAAVMDAIVVCGLAAVPLVQAGQVVVLYVLLALQFSAAAFYEPGEAGWLLACGVQHPGSECMCTVPGWTVPVLSFTARAVPLAASPSTRLAASQAEPLISPAHPTRSPQGAGAGAGACRPAALGDHH